MSTPQRSRLTNNQKLTLIEESQQPGFKIEYATAKYSLSKVIADFEGAEEWKKTVLPKLIEKIGRNLDLLYNANETGLCFRALPDQG